MDSDFGDFEHFLSLCDHQCPVVSDFPTGKINITKVKVKPLTDLDWTSTKDLFGTQMSKVHNSSFDFNLKIN